MDMGQGMTLMETGMTLKEMEKQDFIATPIVNSNKTLWECNKIFHSQLLQSLTKLSIVLFGQTMQLYFSFLCHPSYSKQKDFF